LIPAAVDRAKAAAAELVNRRLRNEAMPETPTTFGQLVKRFEEDKVSEMGVRHEKGVRRELELLQRCVGSATIMATIDETTWNKIARERASGAIDARGFRVRDPEKWRPVRARSVAITLKTLGHLTRWGARVKRRGSTTPLIDSDPCSAMTIPSEKNKRQPMLTDDEFDAMVEAAPKVSDYMRTLLLLAGESGRRIGAICKLRASDLNWDEGKFGEIVWREAGDKGRVRWVAPMTPPLRTELARFSRTRGLIGDALLFRAPKSDGPLTVDRASKWWRACEEAANVPRREGQGWHSLRRRWATARKGHSLRDVAAVGGWKTTQVLSDVYQMADRDAMEAVAVGAKPVRRRAQ
jgi:integrase